MDGVMAPLVELLVDAGVAVVGVVAEGKEGLRTAGVGAHGDEFPDRLGRHERRLARRVVVGAVGAGVPAGRGERDENVAREGQLPGGVDVSGVDLEQSVDGRVADRHLDVVVRGAGYHGRGSSFDRQRRDVPGQSRGKSMTPKKRDGDTATNPGPVSESLPRGRRSPSPRSRPRGATRPPDRRRAGGPRPGRRVRRRRSPA